MLYFPELLLSLGWDTVQCFYVVAIQNIHFGGVVRSTAHAGDDITTTIVRGVELSYAGRKCGHNVNAADLLDWKRLFL